MIMLGINIYSYRDYIKPLRVVDNEKLNEKLEQLNTFRNVIGEKRANLTLAATTTLVTIFYSIYYMSISGIFNNNKFLFVGGIILVLYTIISGASSALRISKGTKFTNQKRLMDYIKLCTIPITTVYLIASLWAIFIIIHQ
jgi:hypothetical protein